MIQHTKYLNRTFTPEAHAIKESGISNGLCSLIEDLMDLSRSKKICHHNINWSIILQIVPDGLDFPQPAAGFSIILYVDIVIAICYV